MLTPTDDDFDDMHHALGRPDGPHVEPYRNRYICEIDGPQAQRFMALDLWDRVGTMNAGRDGIFQVTLAGRAMLMDWLKARQLSKGIRAWSVSGRDLPPRVVMAKSPAAARYEVYLQISDAYDMTFREFIGRGIKARAA